MDLSDLETEMNNVDSSMITPSKHDIFLSTYNRRQRFSLRNSMVLYIAKNPKNAEAYQKMVECCKYFFINNPILILFKTHSVNFFQTICTENIHGMRFKLHNYYGEWITFVNETGERIYINRISTKLWITDVLIVSPENFSNNSLVSSIIPKIYQCDYNYLSLSDQVISLNEFIFLCSSVEYLGFSRVTVNNEDGTEVAFENIIKQLPKVKSINYTFTPSNDTPKTAFKELWKISHFSNYDYFCLYKIPEKFDIESFYSFMKKNKNTRVYLEFSNTISDELKTRLEGVIDEIIGTKNHEYRPPYIDFHFINQEKRNILYDIYNR